MACLSEDGATSGTAEIEGATINWAKDPTSDTITVTIIEEDGTTTELTVPPPALILDMFKRFHHPTRSTLTGCKTAVLQNNRVSTHRQPEIPIGWAKIPLLFMIF